MGRVWSNLAVVLVLLLVPAVSRSQESFDLLIRGGRVIDGTGNPWFSADVGIKDGKIVAVGPLADATASRLLYADCKVIPPRFIDLPSHAGDQGAGPSAPPCARPPWPRGYRSKAASRSIHACPLRAPPS